MRPLSQQDIESELSYAYLHAVASRAGMSCRVGNRHEDNNGIDAQLTAWPPLGEGVVVREVDFKVQLKATIADPGDDGINFEYRLRGVRRYDDLRSEAVAIPRILVVLFLPRDAAAWLEHTADQLLLRRCAYWQSLRGAPAITTDSTSIRLPKTQPFSPEGLNQLVARLSRRDLPVYPAL